MKGTIQFSVGFSEVANVLDIVAHLINWRGGYIPGNDRSGLQPNFKMSQFKEKVIEIVKIIPNGKIVSYGQVAVMAGLPRMARHVGNVLNKYNGEENIPWWRVVNNSGRLTIKGSVFTPEDQKDQLEKEGLEITNDYTFDISKYRFVPDIKLLRKLKLDDEYIELLMTKFDV